MDKNAAIIGKFTLHTKNARIELAHIVMGTIFLVLFSVCEVYWDGGYLQVVEECARQSMGEGCRGGEGIAKLCPGWRG